MFDTFLGRESGIGENTAQISMQVWVMPQKRGVVFKTSKQFWS
jgi:hypothetical protein